MPMVHRADMVQPIPIIPYTVFGTAFTDAVNAAITALNSVISQFGNTSSSVADIEAYAHRIDQQGQATAAIAKAAAAQFGSTTTTVSDIEAYAHKIEGELTQYANSADARIASAQQQASEASDSAADAAASALAAVKASAAVAESLQATVPLNTRPGDSPDAFTTDLYAGSTGLPPTALPVTGVGGQSLRVTGAITLGSVGLRSIEPNRLYKVRAAFRRITDTADPAGAAVSFAVAWYGADRNLLSLPSTEIATVRLAVASGRAQYEALLSLNPPDQSDPSNPRVGQPPTGAAYFRPFVRVFASDVVTDLEVIEHADVTDQVFATSLPLDDVLARLSRLENLLNLPSL